MAPSQGSFMNQQSCPGGLVPYQDPGLVETRLPPLLLDPGHEVLNLPSSLYLPSYIDFRRKGREIILIDGFELC